MPFLDNIVLTLIYFLSLALFGLLAYRNVQQIAHRTLPLVRRELDKQLTVMVLMQVVVDCFSLLPYSIVNIFALNPNINNDPVYKETVQLSFSILLIIHYLYFSVSAN
jgi:hypothetical protein